MVNPINDNKIAKADQSTIGSRDSKINVQACSIRMYMSNRGGVEASSKIYIFIGSKEEQCKEHDTEEFVQVILRDFYI